MNTDRELLELAAKVAGIRGEWSERGQCIVISEAGMSWEHWRPLEDDGDALRLAVRLGIVIDPSGFTTCCEHNSLPPYISESHRDGKDSATRRAIVRAAAEIGRSMQ